MPMVSQIFTNFFELADSVVRVTRVLAYGMFKAVVDVIMHQRLLGVGDGFFHRMELLSDVEAATPLF